MAFLTPDNIRTEHGLVIKEKIIPWGAVWTKNYSNYKRGDKYKADRKLSNGTGKVEYITIHNTPDIKEAKGTNDAEQYTRATYPNQNMGTSRVHYFIDETDCWQNLREDEVGWHAGDGRGDGNETSLGIEIIMDGTGSKADIEAKDRGALLAAILLNRHGLGIERLVTHTYWVNKSAGKTFADVDEQCCNLIKGKKWCPTYIFASTNKTKALNNWKVFKALVKQYLDQITGGDISSDTTQTTAIKVDYAKSFDKSKAGRYKVNASGGLRLRTGASTAKQIIETMPNGSNVRCYGYYTGNWLCVVSASGQVGFCYSSYLTKVSIRANITRRNEYD